MKKPAKPWAPVPVAVQVTRHKKALAAAAKKVHASKAASAKRSAAAKKAAATRAKHRKWSPDEDVALCSARAVAESLRLVLAVAVADGDVLALHAAAGGDDEHGATLSDVLEAACGLHPLNVEELGIGDPSVLASVGQHAGEPDALHIGEPDCLDHFSVALLDRHEPSRPVWLNGHRRHAGGRDDPAFAHALILGLDLPYGEPHAVVAHNGLWWSWGEPHSPADFPGAVIEEAWAVSWARGGDA